MDLSHGGHLTHGHPVTLSAQIYNFIRYKTDASGKIDYVELEKMAVKHKPKLILAGFSAYTRQLDYKKFQAIAKKVGAISMFDIAHIAGLIAGGVLSSPVPYFDVVSSTTHKTLRGPRGAFILCKEQFAKQVDKAVFPGMQGGPHDHITAAKAVAFKEALEPEFKIYCQQIVQNAKTMANRFIELGYNIVSSGTDNHLMVLDLRNKGISGLEAEQALEKIGVSVSRSTIPNDPAPPMKPSGIRIGTPAITTRGFKEAEVLILTNLMDEAFLNKEKEEKLAEIKEKIKDLCKRFPIYK
jgi:glycine hydroxymethyltransferase